MIHIVRIDLLPHFVAVIACASDDEAAQHSASPAPPGVTVIRRQLRVIGVSSEKSQLSDWLESSRIVASCAYILSPVAYPSTGETSAWEDDETKRLGVMQHVVESCASSLCHFVGSNHGFVIFGAWDSASTTAIIMTLASGASHALNSSCSLSEAERRYGLCIVSFPQPISSTIRTRRTQLGPGVIAAESVRRQTLAVPAEPRTGLKRRLSVTSSAECAPLSSTKVPELSSPAEVQATIHASDTVSSTSALFKRSRGSVTPLYPSQLMAAIGRLGSASHAGSGSVRPQGGVAAKAISAGTGTRGLASTGDAAAPSATVLEGSHMQSTPLPYVESAVLTRQRSDSASSDAPIGKFADTVNAPVTESAGATAAAAEAAARARSYGDLSDRDALAGLGSLLLLQATDDSDGTGFNPPEVPTSSRSAQPVGPPPFVGLAVDEEAGRPPQSSLMVGNPSAVVADSSSSSASSSERLPGDGPQLQSVPPPLSANALSLGGARLLLPKRETLPHSSVAQGGRPGGLHQHALASRIVQSPFAVDVLAVVTPVHRAAPADCPVRTFAMIRRVSSEPRVCEVPLPPLVSELRCAWVGGSTSSRGKCQGDVDPPNSVAALGPVLVGVFRAAAAVLGVVYPVPLPVTQTSTIVPLDWAEEQLTITGAYNAAHSRSLIHRLLLHLPALSQTPRVDLLSHPRWPGTFDSGRPSADVDRLRSGGAELAQSSCDVLLLDVAHATTAPGTSAASAAPAAVPGLPVCDHGARFLRGVTALVLLV